MKVIVEKIRHLTMELRAIEAELLRKTAVVPRADDAAQTLDPLLDVKMMEEFKAAVDSMRILLWSYLEAAAEAEGANLHLAMHSLRLQRVTEMLRVLEEPFESPWAGHQLANTPEGNSFLTQVNRIASMTLDRYDLQTNRVSEGEEN